MFKRFYPDIYIDSAYDIDYEGLYNKGYRGIIFDIDNTLVEHGAPVTKKCSDLFDSLRAIGFDTCIISNNKEPRVKPLADACGSRYVSKAAKPSPVNYIKAMNIMGTDRNNTFFVEDKDNGTAEKYAKLLIETGKAKAVICGWCEKLSEKYEVNLKLLIREK